MYSTEDNDPKVDAICNNLFYHKRNWCVLEEYDEDRKLVYKYTHIHEAWITEPERQQQKEELSRQMQHNRDREQEQVHQILYLITMNTE